MRTAEDWPLQTFLELGALPSAVPCARLHARQVLWEWGQTSLGDGVELLVAELVTNAITAAAAADGIPTVRLWMLSDKTQVLILVWDASPEPPVRKNLHAEAESGRGLLLVEAFSERWDWYFPQEMGGKVVWCLTPRGINVIHNRERRIVPRDR